MSFSHYACLWGMSAAVEGEVVRAGEAAVTVAAFEWFNPGVFAVMPCQFVRASELPCAVIPRALVWLFTWERKYSNINKKTWLFCGTAIELFFFLNMTWCTCRLTCVCAPVGFKMRALGVNLIAALELTSVNASPLWVRWFWRPGPPQTLNTERQQGTAMIAYDI